MKQILTDKILTEVIRPRKEETHKYNYGKVLLIGGNKNYGGAIIMSAQAAVNSGAGLVTVACDPINVTSLHSVLPEAVFCDYSDFNNLNVLIEKSEVISIGSGLGTDSQGFNYLKQVFSKVSNNQVLIIDGSAFSIIRDFNLSLPTAKIILTPHQGEWQTYSNLNISDQNPTNNQEFLKHISKNVVLILKKHRTEIYHQNQFWENSTGNASMATAGMGDTLTGMIAGFCAQFPNYVESAKAAVYLHGLIGDHLSEKRYVTIPSEIVKEIPLEMKLYSLR